MVSRLISFTSMTSRFWAPLWNCERILPIISAARCASLANLATTERTSSRSGLSRPSFRRQVLALVMAPLIG